MKKNDIQKYHGHYSEHKLTGKLPKVARKAGQKLTYAILLLYYVLRSPSVNKGDKATILGALGYFILPLDILPDFVPIVGFTDDLSAILLALHAVWKNITPEVKAAAAQKTAEIFGDFDQKNVEEQLMKDE
jgi:uncharacterized membrane protein YkvA (DUF1232 family)